MTGEEEKMLLSFASVLDEINSEVYAITRKGEALSVTTPTKQFQVGLQTERS